MDLQIPQELNPDYQDQSLLEQFHNHPELSNLSLLSLNAKLYEFTTSPFYSFFAGQLQALADEAMASIVSGFQTRDRIAILEREQTIGAAPAYLKFSQLVAALRSDLQQQITKQDGPQ